MFDFVGFVDYVEVYLLGIGGVFVLGLVGELNVIVG